MPNILQRLLIFASGVAFILTGCSGGPGQGPGFTEVFVNVIKDTTVMIESSRTSDGKPFPNAGSVSDSPGWRSGGKVMGFAPDGRELPNWVEFVWIETPYGVEYSYEQLRAMPRRTQRVMIRSRIPDDVVGDIRRANKRCAPGQLPDTDLNVYFVWTTQGVKLRWAMEKEVMKGVFKSVREGGDEIPGG
jgi:hypothetical protein